MAGVSRGALALTLVSILVGCSGGGSGGGSSSTPAPAVTIQAASASVVNGGNATLSWSSTNATGCTAGDAWFGGKPTSGTQAVGPVVASSTFSLTCTGPGGTGSAAVAVAVSFGAGQLAFNRTVLSNGTAPWAKGFGDIDGDGLRDVVAGGGTVMGGRIVWYRQPGWQSYLISAVGGGDSLLVADINGDGAVDVVTSNGLSWFENPRGSGGDPTQPWVRRSIDLNLVAHDLAVGDVNGDGRLDVVARPEGSGPIAVYLQTAGGGWSSVQIPLASAPLGIGLALADVDADGRLDIVPGGYWLRAPANPLVDPWVRREIGVWPNNAAVAVADLDGDGRKDVILSPSLAGPGFLAWFKAPADPLTGAWTRNDILAVEDVHAFHAVRMDQDNNIDIVFAEMHTAPLHRIGILFNNGAATSWTLQTISTDGSHNIAVADINGDGALDILGSNSDAASTDGGALNVWFGAP